MKTQLSHKLYGSLLFVVLLVTGCGGGGSDEGSTMTGSGRFIDGPVSGLHYQSGAHSGTTNANGEFIYELGNTIIFSYGGVAIGDALGAEIITPRSLVKDSDHADTLVNLLRFLQTLDQDSNHDNGIELVDLSSTVITINFNQSRTDFAADSDVTQFLDEAHAPESLIDDNQALANFEQALVNEGINSDSDNDGIPDLYDIFPTDATETTDTDGDGIGDNSDPDADTPHPTNDAFSVFVNSINNRLEVLVNDSFGLDLVGTSALKISSWPTSGTASVDDNGTAADPTDDVILYSPNSDFIGADSLTYEIADSDDSTASATVAIAVNEEGPLNWRFYGDSQTAGRASEATAVSHAVAFKNIWIATLGTVPDVDVSGVSGRSLYQTNVQYTNDADHATDSWVHFQESGNQNHDFQRTVSEFIATFESFVRQIRVDSPSARISAETAYSFQREHQAYRNWTSYNIALKNKISELRAEGIEVYLAEVDANIKALIDQLSFQEVITDDGGHYRGIGNLMVALSIYDALGYDVNSLDLSSILEISDENKALCLTIINAH